MEFVEIPLDAILEISCFLDFRDAFHLLVTCSSLESLLSLKDFWLKTLVRFQTVHLLPLPCPIGANIFDMPVDALRKLAIHAYTLKKNWTTERATPVSIRTITLDGECRRIFVIPGSNLVVTSDHQRLVCWDTQSGACIRVIQLCPDDEDRTYFSVQSPPFHLPGQSFIALTSRSWPDVELMVVKLDYGNSNDITFCKIYSNVWPIDDFQPISFPDAAFNDQMIGMVFTSKIDEFSTLVYNNFGDGNTRRRVPLGIRLGTAPVCVLKDGHFYINGQEKDEPSAVLLTTPHGVVPVTSTVFRTFLSRPGPAQFIPRVQFSSMSDKVAQFEFDDLASYEHHFDITPGTSVHVLDTGELELNYFTVVVALDDALGVVYVTHIGTGADSTLYILSYA
ncbi:hypothetical protein B0H19DRAFT_1066997 [Mycena capillaripes]|nr:hypothetical protein B0H19DRAFT_1066997 [Mycena capillaripes]